MDKIVIYGKGGVGKSTVASNLSAVYAAQGHRVLHIGCDPKQDSTFCLLERYPPVTVIDEVMKGGVYTSEQIINPGRLNIDCIEAGGPEPGEGCGGRGIILTMEIVERLNIIPEGGYDTVIFDVLGDVVCGGFAAPLKQGFGEKIVIVVSDELMSLFAANNISKVIHKYQSNGIYLCGLIANLTAGEADTSIIEHFAKSINTQILAYIRFSKLIRQAEMERMTLAEYASNSDMADIFRDLSDRIKHISRDDVASPTPMHQTQFQRFIEEVREKRC